MPSSLVYQLLIEAVSSPSQEGKTYWEGGAWVEPGATSKLLSLPNFHIKEKSVVIEGQYP